MNSLVNIYTRTKVQTINVYESVKSGEQQRQQFEATTIHKIFETNSSFHVKQRTTGKVQFLFFSRFLLVLTKFSFWEEDWALGYNSMKF